MISAPINPATWPRWREPFAYGHAAAMKILSFLFINLLITLRVYSKIIVLKSSEARTRTEILRLNRAMFYQLYYLGIICIIKKPACASLTLFDNETKSSRQKSVVIHIHLSVCFYHNNRNIARQIGSVKFSHIPACVRTFDFKDLNCSLVAIPFPFTLLTFALRFRLLTFT